MARSVRSRDCSPETVARRMDSGVSVASRSSTLEVAAVASMVDWTLSASCWAAVTFSTASSMNFFRTSCEAVSYLCLHPFSRSNVLPITHLDGRDIGVLGQILVLVQGVLGQLSLLLLDGQLNKQEHDRLQRGDGSAPRALVGDVLMEQGQGRLGLVDPDQLVGALQDIFGLLMRRRRLEDGEERGLASRPNLGQLNGMEEGQRQAVSQPGIGACRGHHTHHAGQSPPRIDGESDREIRGQRVAVAGLRIRDGALAWHSWW